VRDEPMLSMYAQHAAQAQAGYSGATG